MKFVEYFLSPAVRFSQFRKVLKFSQNSDGGSDQTRARMDLKSCRLVVKTQGIFWWVSFLLKNFDFPLFTP